MEFKVHKRGGFNKKKYEKSDIDLAYKFAKKASKEFGTFLRAVVLFGSTTKRNKKKQGDIDVLMIVDDVTYMLSPEIVETYRIVIEKLIAEVSFKLHITTLKFTTFWDYTRIGDPVGINILRNGVALIDTGFFYPLQLLLYQGKIRPTKEAVQSYFSRAPTTLYNSKWHVLQGTLDLYWAVIDAAHAALMKQGVMPPAPNEIAEVMEKELVKKKLLDKKYPKIMRKLYVVSRMILHREIKTVDGKTYEAYYKEAKDFIDTMKKIIDIK